MNQIALIPPQACLVEENVLGSMLIGYSSLNIAFNMLTSSDFYKPEHISIFQAMLELNQLNQPVDLISVEERLKKNGISISGHILSDLTRNTSSSNTEHYCQIIKEKSIKRNLISICNDTLNECYDPGADTYDVVDSIQDKVFKVINTQEGNLHHISDTITALTSKISEIQKHGRPIGLQTGLCIDDVLQGFQNAKLYIIGARPSMGKTAFAMTIMRRLAKDGHVTGIISLETSHETLGNRLVSQVSGLPAKHIFSGNLTREEMKSFLDASNQLYELGIYIDDSSSATAQQIRSKCLMMKRKKVDIIFIDFLTLIKTQGRNKHEEVGEITKMAKAISKELNIPIVMLAQLSRKVEDRADKRPQLSDLRESGSIEEDADCVILLNRPEYYGIEFDENKNSTKGIAEIIIAKNKDGATGIKRLFFEKETMCFKNIN